MIVLYIRYPNTITIINYLLLQMLHVFTTPYIILPFMLTPVSLTIPRLTNYTKYDNAHVTSAYVNALLAFDPTSYVLKEKISPWTHPLFAPSPQCTAQ